MDRTFGFDTAVEEAQNAINAAHIEVPNFLRPQLMLYYEVKCTLNDSEERMKTKDDSDVAIGATCAVVSSSRQSMSICNPKLSIARIRGPPKTTASFQKCKTLNGHGHADLRPTWLVEISPLRLGELFMVGCTRMRVLGRPPI